MHRRQIIHLQLQTQFSIYKYILHFSFTNNICTSKYNHLIELGVEGQKITSHRHSCIVVQSVGYMFIVVLVGISLCYMCNP
jgi:hypothetical protein